MTDRRFRGTGLLKIWRRLKQRRLHQKLPHEVLEKEKERGSKKPRTTRSRSKTSVAGGTIKDKERAAERASERSVRNRDGVSCSVADRTLLVSARGSPHRVPRGGGGGDGI